MKYLLILVGSNLPALVLDCSCFCIKTIRPRSLRAVFGLLPELFGFFHLSAALGLHVDAGCLEV